MPSDAGPAAPAEHRLGHLDLIRGYALLGVLLMNIHFWFRAPLERYSLSPHPFPGAWNVATDHVLGVWFAGKSVTLFAMLFAIGLCMQREAFEAQGRPWLPFGTRRLGVALAFGFLHVGLLWVGDILHQYALTGWLILPFLGLGAKAVNRWVTGVLLFTVTAVVLFSWMQAASGPGSYGPPPEAQAQARTLAAALTQGYTQPTWWGVAQTRLFHYRSAVLGMLPVILAFTGVNFLIGVRIWKSGLLQDPLPHRDRLRRWAWIGIPLGVLLCLPSELAPGFTETLKAHWKWAWLLLPVVGISQAFGALVLALGLGSALLTLWLHPRWRVRLGPLTAVGRMGFTNYILQSLVCSWIFQGYGLGLYNRVGPLGGALIGLMLFALQVPLSGAWLRRFQFGPLEWAWRALAYGRVPPFRRVGGAPSG